MNSNKTHQPARLLAAVFAIFVFAAAAFGADVTATPAYPFTGVYQKEAAQGFAIHKDSAFLFNNTGIVRIYDLKNGKFIASFPLESSAPENHANCVNFGVEFPAGNTAYPAIYISECYGYNRCFVESITNSGSRLVQTLQIRTGGTEDRSFDWVVDQGNKCLYAISIVGVERFNKKNPTDYLVTKLRLPKLSEGAVVTFTREDILDQFNISFWQLSQGGTIRGDYLYLPVGREKPAMPVGNWNAKPKKDVADRGLLVVNLRTKKIEQELDLNEQLEREPEDAAFHGDDLLVLCGQRGWLWKLTGYKGSK